MATRTATIKDLPRISELLAELRAMPVDLDTVKTQFDNRFDNKGRAVILALDEAGDAVGVAVMNMVYKLPKLECRLDEVIVASSVRGQGYGRNLIEACEEWAWKNGADSIDLTSRASREAANGLYRALGFELRDTNVYTKQRVS